MPLRFPTLHRSLLLAITIALLGSTTAAQDPRQAQIDSAMRLMLECQQLITEGSPASLTNAVAKCEAAGNVLHSLNLPAGEGLMMVMTGYAYSQLDQNQK